MPPALRAPLKRYAVAIAAVVAAALLTVPLEPHFHGRAPLFLFLAAVVAAGAYGGAGPGLVATAFCAAIADRFFELQILVLTVNHATIILFAAVGAAVSLILGHFQKSNRALRQANDSLEIANQKLAERGEALAGANEELQRFAYALAHDLNAPLRGISALTDLLLERNAGKLDRSSKECAEMIVAKVGRMRAMIKGLLDYASTVEKSEERAMADLNAVVARALEDLDSAIREREAQVSVDPLPTVPCAAAHLVQVFTNLIGNAIKYCPRVRRPEVRITATEQSGDWVVCIADNGIGLDMKYARDIFGMFRRLHGEGQYEGSGIGLALCRTVIERHGGRIWVESEAGQGSRFLMSLPKRSESPPSGERNSPAAVSSLNTDSRHS